MEEDPKEDLDGLSEQERTIRNLEAQVTALRRRPTFHVGQLGTLILSWPGTMEKKDVAALPPVAALITAGWRLTANGPLNNFTVVAGPSWQLVPPGI